MSDITYSDNTHPDLNDTGIWRLTISVACDGMTAALRHMEDKAAPPVMLFSSSWPSEEESLLSRIETTVYDHPRILDDFATEIIIVTPKTLWVPSELLDEEGAEEKYYTGIYTADPEDILSDPHGSITCLYSLTPGMAAFFGRTLPGCRIRSHMSVLFDRFSTQTSELTRLYVDIRDGAADFLTFHDRQLICASTAPWSAPADIAYRIFLTADAYGIDPAALDIRLSGHRDTKSALASILRDTGLMVTFTPLPAGIPSEHMTLAMALAMSR